MQKLFKLLLLLCAVSFVLAACKDDETMTGDEDEYFRATIDGVAKDITYSQNAYNISYVAQNSAYMDSTGAIVSYTKGPGSQLWQDTLTATFLGGLDMKSAERPAIFFGQNVFTEREWALDSLNNFNAIFQTGTYTYMDNDPDNVEVPGIEIVWRDANDKTWTSRDGSQSGSAFSVTSTREHITPEGDSQNKVEGKFNCTLYDNSGNSIDVQNGEFFMTFQIL